MITYFKDKNNKSKKKYKKYKTRNTIFESIDSIVIIGGLSTSRILSITGVGLIILPVSAGIACTLSLRNKVLHKIIINKYKKRKKQYEQDQQNFKSFDKLYRKFFQKNVIDETDYDTYVIFLLNMLIKTKMNLSYKQEFKFKIKLF